MIRTPHGPHHADCVECQLRESLDTITALLAERDTLRQQLTAAQVELKRMKELWQELVRERDAAQADKDTLKALRDELFERLANSDAENAALKALRNELLDRVVKAAWKGGVK